MHSCDNWKLGAPLRVSLGATDFMYFQFAIIMEYIDTHFRFAQENLATCDDKQSSVWLQLFCTLEFCIFRACIILKIVVKIIQLLWKGSTYTVSATCPFKYWLTIL